MYMTKYQFLERIKYIPDDAQIIIYDYYTYGQQEYRLDLDKYKTGDSNLPLIAIEINYKGRE